MAEIHKARGGHIASIDDTQLALKLLGAIANHYGEPVRMGNAGIVRCDLPRGVEMDMESVVCRPKFGRGKR